MKSLTFTINPNFRLQTPHLRLTWHIVPLEVLQSEAVMLGSIARIYSVKSVVEIIILFREEILDIIYHVDTDFSTSKIQKWLREQIKAIIYEVANRILPMRVAYWEKEKGMKGSGAIVKKQRKNTMACCTFQNQIQMQPYLILFKQEWLDAVILHEMVHYKYKHHRKSFWNLLSTLLGEESKLQKVKQDIAMSPFFEFVWFLTK